MNACAPRLPRWRLHVLLTLVATALTLHAAEPKHGFRAGAHAIDITPTNFPVIVNAMFEERSAGGAHDALHARCLVLDDGATRIAIAVVDTCMLPRALCDEAKELARQATGIPTERMLISATHTHSAPSAMGCLGSRADTNYQRFLVPRIAQGIEQAAKNLAPARVGWTVAQDYEHTFCRRWIRRPDKMISDPFGVRNVRANMHPGYQNPDAIGPSGPVDPDLSILSIQTPDGRPIALLANYSMHYFGSPLLSSDYYGLFAIKIGRLIGADTNASPPFVGIMSQGTSGDQMWMDYGSPQKNISLDQYAQEVAQVAFDASRRIEHRDWAPLVMRESQLTLNFRLADEQRLAWARQAVTNLADRLPRSQPEIYAWEQLHLRDRPQAELKLQALRIGELGIAAMPNEVYAISGLKIKAQSPLTPTFNMELANGSEGYIPPPEQHKLGGYTTWAARTAGLEVTAEPKIVEGVLALLEAVSGKPRRQVSDTHGPYAEAVLASKPLAYWRLNEFNGPLALDATGNGTPATFEDGIVFHLPGVESEKFSGRGVSNRAAHFAGGRLKADLKLPGNIYSVGMWFWNGLPNDARPVTGYLFSHGPDGADLAPGDHLGIGGTHHNAHGRLIVFNGNQFNQVLTGSTVIEPKTWNHVMLAREGPRVVVYLNGNAQPEISGELEISYPENTGQVFIGGRNDNFANFEGKIDEVAVYHRVVPPEEVAAQYRESGQPPKPLTPRAQLSSQPGSPADSPATIHVPDGFAVELVVAEPLVQSPVAIEWGADGKLWVAEMADYPMGMDGMMKPGGRIRVLEDTDGDGKFDKSTVFLSGVKFPNGLITWRKGVIVTAAPDIFYAEDTDGDGRADKREVLFTGFKEGNLQLRVNGLRWGLDGWLHCANGWSGGVAKSVKTDAQLDLSGRDLRIKPDEGLIELQSGQSEFGRNRDDWGNWFGCDNSYPLFHFVLDDHYLRRNPHVTSPEAKRQLFSPNPQVYPRSEGQKRYHSFEQAGRFTSACSTEFYRDEWLFPRDMAQHAFVCEPVHNLVQHLLVSEDGTSFTARRAESGKEADFVSSGDQWFRPVMARTGPEGALWIVDMYRYMIEHPDWLPPEGRKELEPFYRAGEERGRIYRIMPSGGAKGRGFPRLDQMNTVQLVAALESPNGWVRDKAQQLLMWRADRAAVEPLEKLVAGSRSARGRLHALWTLDGLAGLKPSVVAAALRDEHPAVRRDALRLAESRAKDAPELIAAAIRLVNDPDLKVRQQLASTLGEWDDPRAGAALGQLALANTRERYVAAAVMSSTTRHAPAFVDAVIAGGAAPMTAYADRLLGLTLALNQRESVAKLLQEVMSPIKGEFTAEQFQVFGRFLETLARRSNSLDKVMLGADDALAKQLRVAPQVFAAARRAAADTNGVGSRRVAATSLLGRERARADQDQMALAQLLAGRNAIEVRLAAVKALGATGQRGAAESFFAGWFEHPPELRSAMVEVLLGREEWTLALLGRMDDGLGVAPEQLSPSQRDRLLKHRTESVRKKAKEVLSKTSNPDRQKVMEQFRPALTAAGDATRGREMFSRLCAQCHRLDGVGHEIGPNLKSVSAHPPDKLLVAILDPSREVAPNFLAYICSLHGGEEFYGMIVSETGNSITMKLTDDTTRTLLRSEIRQLSKSTVSLMPEGLEAGLAPQDLADLIRYLKTQ